MSSAGQFNSEIIELEKVLASRAKQLRDWLVTHAYSVWWQQGSDPAGGFHERIGQSGKAVVTDNRRARVQPRQAYCYAEAGQFGWDGPWRDAVEHGLSWLERAYRRPDGVYGSLVNPQGELIDPVFDLYNHSFALFGFAAAAAAIPERFDEYHERALGILHQLKTNYKHPSAGFEEENPPREPLCSNPHMHMFEAALRWEVVAPSESQWSGLADEIANLAMDRMVDSDTGALREFFGRNWHPLEGARGSIVEPGHQFEWAWLFTIWAERRQHPRALNIAGRLFELAECYGICSERNVAMMSLHGDFTVHNDLARLWSQTEWLKASLRLRKHSKGVDELRYLKSSIRAIEAVFAFIEEFPAGLWGDKWPAGSTIVDEPAPASTLYHIVAAAAELENIGYSTPRVTGGAELSQAC